MIKTYALIGRRLGHSFSQRWFEGLFARLGLADHRYLLAEMEGVEDVRQWVQREGIAGFNVTVPFKQAILTQLDALDATAQAVGAVNCVTVEPSGRLVGHNTDAPAFLQTLVEFLGGKMPQQAYILGTGGAAQAVAWALKRLEIPYTFVSRHPELHPQSIGYQALPTTHHPLPTLLINTTPVGMYPDVDQSPLDLSGLRSPLSTFLFYDLIYNPSPTLLLRETAERGAAVTDGTRMLHRQAELSWELWREL